MKKGKFFRGVIGFLLVFMILGIGGVYAFLNFPKNENYREEKESVQPEENHEDSISEKVLKQMDEMSLDEKIAQMLIVSDSGYLMDDELEQELVKNQPGGFIFFKDNFDTYEQTVKLINDIQGTARIPMFLAIDQEGGKVQRLTSLGDVSLTKVPAMQEVGRTKNPELAYDVGKVIAEELRVFGINLDFAPVVDVVDNPLNTVIGNRSFGGDATLVSQFGTSLARGLEENGVIPVYKHFPGHGSTVTDSHYYLPVLTKTKEELLQKDLIPFQEAIKNHAKVIMVGHLAVPEITKDNTPASLSKTLITDLLKEELGYSGLVVTDALNMKAISDHYSEQEIYELAINAGVDLLLMPPSASSAIEKIKASIIEGTIQEEQIDRSVLKILTLKYESLTEKNNLPKEVLGSLEHQEVIRQISESLKSQ